MKNYYSTLQSANHFLTHFVKRQGLLQIAIRITNINWVLRFALILSTLTFQPGYAQNWQPGNQLTPQMHLADITVTNGSAANLSSSDNITFTADITPVAYGDVAIDVAADVATDLAGNGNTAATQFTIQYGTILGLENNLAGQLSVYPNPILREAAIAAGSFEQGEYQLRLVDITGKA